MGRNSQEPSPGRPNPQTTDPTSPPGPLALRTLLRLGGATLAAAALYALLSTLGRLVLYWEAWNATGLGAAVANQLTASWFLAELLLLVLFPLAIHLMGRWGPRRWWLQLILYFFGGAVIGLGIQVALASLPGFAMLSSALTLLVLAGLAALPLRWSLALLIPAAYALFVVPGLLPQQRGMDLGLGWVLGLEAPLVALAQVLLIEGARLGVLLALVHAWRRALSRSRSPRRGG